MIKNIFVESEDIFLSIEDREVYSGQVVEPGLLRIFNKNDSSVSLVVAPQFKKYQDKQASGNRNNLTKDQLDMFNNFFSEYSSNNLIETCLVRILLFICLEKKKMVCAKEKDVTRALSCFGNKMTADEFLNFLSLFFASESNVCERVKYFLMQQFNSCSYLTTEQAIQTLKFLRKFYGIKTGSIKLITSNGRISMKKYESLINPLLKVSTFVKW